MKHQTMLVNENRLNLADQRARQYLARQMESFFFGDGRRAAGRATCRRRLKLHGFDPLNRHYENHSRFDARMRASHRSGARMTLSTVALAAALRGLRSPPCRWPPRPRRRC